MKTKIRNKNGVEKKGERGGGTSEGKKEAEFRRGERANPLSGRRAD